MTFAAVARVALVLALGAFASGVPARCWGAASDPGWRQYEDPTSTVEMDLPVAWRPGKAIAKGASHVVTFRLPEAGADLTLSITPELRHPGEVPLDLVRAAFPHGAATRSPVRTRGKGWVGVRQEATAEVAGQPRTWLGQFYVFGSTLVAVTLSDDSARIATRQEEFERIVKSIRYHEPAVDTARGDGVPALPHLASAHESVARSER